ncbi:MAG: hypothetical protein Q9O24_03860 [Gammaproteobacteria bacterium]|nr:hypothetical protein [Gammaproteobacteria bacterium]
MTKTDFLTFLDDPEVRAKICEICAEHASLTRSDPNLLDALKKEGLRQTQQIEQQRSEIENSPVKSSAAKLKSSAAKLKSSAAKLKSSAVKSKSSAAKSSNNKTNSTLKKKPIPTFSAKSMP